MDKNPFIRRQIVQEISKGSFSTQCLFHMVHYDQAASAIVKEAKRLGRPLTVLSVGCGDMWELRVLVQGMRVKKADVLREYIGIDAVNATWEPFGPKLSEEIAYRYVVADLDHNHVLPIDTEYVDVIICTEFIEHISLHGGLCYLDEAARVIRPGGLMHITTANAANSTGHSDPYHIYEWELEELIEALGPEWDVFDVLGTYIGKIAFDRANKHLERVPQFLVDDIRARFPSRWANVILATSYPEQSRGISLMARKRG